MEEKKDVLILAIESSCDETASAVVKNGREVLSNVISSQIALHTLYGGVVPEIASRKHIEKINEVIQEAAAANEPPSPGGRRLKILYASQPSVCPPHFVIFVNDETLVHFSYKRYLENALRRAFGFSGTPVKLTFRGKKEEK